MRRRDEEGDKDLQKLVLSILSQLARYYHWGREEILNYVYLDEAIYYVNEAKRAEVEGYIMLSHISLLPHTKQPRKFVDALIKQLRTDAENYTMDEEAQPDIGAFNKLRQIMTDRKAGKVPT